MALSTARTLPQAYPIGDLTPGRAARRLQDRLLAVVILVVSSPLLALIAVLILLDDPGPVLFRQEREGFDGKRFLMLKFRSMRVEAADPACAQQTRRGDPRVTRCGRFIRRTSLDELPQLLNVLTGEMSLVGPRPHAPGMRTEGRTSAEIVPFYARRHSVLPGITGLAQINGWRGPTETTAQLVGRVRDDLRYIDDWSFWLDQKILVLTLWRGFIGRNAY